MQTKLSDLTVDGVINVLERIEDLKPALPKLTPILKENAISGRVLKYCELNDLKQVRGKIFFLLPNNLIDLQIGAQSKLWSLGTIPFAYQHHA